MGTTIYIVISVLLIFALSVMLVRRYVENMALYDALKIKLNENTELEKTCGKLEFDNAKLQLELKRYKDTLKDEGRYLVTTTHEQKIFQGSHRYDMEILQGMERPDIEFARDVFLHTMEEFSRDDEWFNAFVHWKMKTSQDDPMIRQMEKRIDVKFIMYENPM